jgi:nucleoid DNA-binding protein
MALDAFVGAIHESLKKKEGKIRISDLGTFKVVKKKARTGVNPQTRQKIKIPATKVPRFSASRALKESVKKAK